MAKVEVNWSGRAYSLCVGEWTLKIDGVDFSDKIPEALRDCPMNCYGHHQRWSFTNGWDVSWEYYCDGMRCAEWVRANRTWLDTITRDPRVQEEIYEAFAARDWRHGECGGCI